MNCADTVWFCLSGTLDSILVSVVMVHWNGGCSYVWQVL